MGNTASTNMLELRMVEDLWLNYFNRYLFENGTITEKEYKRMTGKIAERKTKYTKVKTAC